MRDAYFWVTIPGCIVGLTLSILLWKAFYHAALPKLCSLVVATPWWARARQSQKHYMYGIGFPRTMPDIDVVAVELFVLLCLAALAHVVAGVAALPLVLIGWEAAGDGTRNLFFVSTLLFLGWILFHAIDLALWQSSFQERSVLSWARPQILGSSGPHWTRPHVLWILICGTYLPFWLTLVLPTNAERPQISSYHLLFSSFTFGVGFELASRSFRPKSVQTITSMCQPRVGGTHASTNDPFKASP